MSKVNDVMKYLDELIPNPKCELHYEKDYELLLAVMLSAQTTDKKVNVATERLFYQYPTLESLRDADIDDLIEIIRPIGTYHRKAFNIKKIAGALLEQSNGMVPNDREFLESLSGVGRKTANVVLSNLYEENCIAVDTHVTRVSIRLGFAKEKDDVKVIEQKLTKTFPQEKLGRLHHQLVLFGRYYCKAMKPECENCGLKKYCRYKKNK